MNTTITKQKPSFEIIEPGFGHSYLYQKFDSSKNNKDTVWHYHPEIELVYVKGGSGKRQIGSHISYYSNGDLMLIGSNLPHCGFTDVLTGNDCEVVAFADIDDRMIASSLKIFDKFGKPKPKVFKNGPYDYKNLLAEENIDAVIIATPWRWHSEQAISAMKAGKYVGTEVCGAFSVDECWQLVNAQEET